MGSVSELATLRVRSDVRLGTWASHGGKHTARRGGIFSRTEQNTRNLTDSPIPQNRPKSLPHNTTQILNPWLLSKHSIQKDRQILLLMGQGIRAFFKIVFE